MSGSTVAKVSGSHVGGASGTLIAGRTINSGNKEAKDVSSPIIAKDPPIGSPLSDLEKVGTSPLSAGTVLLVTPGRNTDRLLALAEVGKSHLGGTSGGGDGAHTVELSIEHSNKSFHRKYGGIDVSSAV